VTPKTRDAYEKWLLKHYATRTARKYLNDTLAIEKYGGQPPHAKMKLQRLRDYRLAWDVYSAFGGPALSSPRPVIPDASSWNKSENRRLRGGRKADATKRLRPAVSFTKDDYWDLADAAEADPAPAARIVAVIARTGLRVGDVLRAPLGDLRAAMKRDDGVVTIIVKGSKPVTQSLRGGGASEKAWIALLDAFRKAPSGWNVAEALMETPGASPEAGFGAYERVRVKLERLGKESEVKGRVHLHRFRRTVMTGLFSSGASVDQVQKVGGHDRAATSQTYADESRAVESAKLLKRLERKR